MDTLHILVEGPFVLCDDDKAFCILIPDLLDTHSKPAFVATHNSGVIENGFVIVETGSRKKRDPGKRVPTNDGFDKFSYARAANHQAYAVVVLLPAPNRIEGISPTSAAISDDGVNEGLKPKSEDYWTRAVLIYDAVDLAELKISHNVKFQPMDNSTVEGINGVGLLGLEMKPLGAANDDHAMMAYRAMAKMVGANRYMRPDAMRDPLERGKYDDCRAALMLVSPPPPPKP
jgi:hypothetical protein